MIKNWIHKPEAKQAAVAVGVISLISLVSYAGWRYYRNHNKQSDPLKPFKKPTVGRRFLKDQAYWTAVNNIKAAATDDIKNGRLSKNVLIGINKAMMLLVQDEYLANLTENRKLRRNLMSNLQQYSQELARGNQKNEALLKEGEKEVVRDIGMDEKFYTQQSNYAYHDDPNVAYMSIFLLESLKSKLETKNKDLKKDNLVAYFIVQVDNFDKYNFQDLGLATDALLATKQTFMSDLASIQLKIEEEDLLRNKMLLAEPEVVEASKKLDEKVYYETQKTNRFSY